MFWKPFSLYFHTLLCVWQEFIFHTNFPYQDGKQDNKKAELKENINNNIIWLWNIAVTTTFHNTLYAAYKCFIHMTH